MAAKIDSWRTETQGGTMGEMTAYAGDGSYSIVFRENGHKKVVYQFRELENLVEAVKALKRGWLSAARGK